MDNIDKKIVFSVVAGIAVFGGLMFAVSRLPSTVPGAGVVKEAAKVVKGEG